MCIRDSWGRKAKNWSSMPDLRRFSICSDKLLNPNVGQSTIMIGVGRLTIIQRNWYIFRLLSSMFLLKRNAWNEVVYKDRWPNKRRNSGGWQGRSLVCFLPVLRTIYWIDGCRREDGWPLKLAQQGIRNRQLVCDGEWWAASPFVYECWMVTFFFFAVTAISKSIPTFVALSKLEIHYRS